MANSNNSSINPTNNHQLSNTTNSTNHINISNRNHTSGSGNNQMTINTSHNQNISNTNGNGQMTAVVSHSNQISLTCSSNNNFNLTNNDGHISMTTTASNQNQHQHQQSIIDSGNVVNHRSNVISGNNNRMGNTPIVTSAPPLVLSLSQVSVVYYIKVNFRCQLFSSYVVLVMNLIFQSNKENVLEFIVFRFCDKKDKAFSSFLANRTKFIDVFPPIRLLLQHNSTFRSKEQLEVFLFSMVNSSLSFVRLSNNINNNNSKHKTRYNENIKTIAKC